MKWAWDKRNTYELWPPSSGSRRRGRGWSGSAQELRADRRRAPVRRQAGDQGALPLRHRREGLARGHARASSRARSRGRGELVGAEEVIVQELIPGVGRHAARLLRLLPRRASQPRAWSSAACASTRPCSDARARSCRRSSIPSWRSSRAVPAPHRLLRPGRARVQARRARRPDEAARRQRPHLGLPQPRSARGRRLPLPAVRRSVSPSLSGPPDRGLRAPAGAGRFVDPARHRRPHGARPAGTRRARTARVCLFAAGANTESVFSRDDPLPGMAELALLPYLAVKRGF